MKTNPHVRVLKKSIRIVRLNDVENIFVDFYCSFNETQLLTYFYLSSLKNIILVVFIVLLQHTKWRFHFHFC